MRIYKDTPFEIGLMPWEFEPGELLYLVFVKGTFSLVPGRCEIAEEQATIQGEVPFDDHDRPSVRCASDFAVVKPRGEWLLTGSAFAPGGRPVTVLPVHVRVGPLEKQLVVYGDRRWERGVLGAKPSAPQPFTEMPLRWERSFGGPRHPENPSGCGTVAVEGPTGRIEPLPNIEDPRRPIVSKDDRPPPAGAFPIPSTWPARTRLLGTFDDEWKRARWPYFPRDFDPHFYQAAPADQQLPQGYWRGDERIVLRGLSASHAVLETKLPGLRARVFVEWDPARRGTNEPAMGEVPRPTLDEVGMVLDTIAIDSAAATVCCTWRGLIRGVADVKMSNVARLFAIHEPLEADEARAYYEDWLWRLLRDEAAEAQAVEAEVPAAAPPEVSVPEAVAAAELAALGLGTSIRGVYAAIGELLDAEEAVFGKPKASDIRAAFEREGIEPPAELVDPEPPPAIPEEEPDPPSLRRLAALVRCRLGRPFDGADLTGAPFRGLDLRNASFRGCILTDADLRGARLDGAVFDDAVLVRARLEGASLVGASLQRVELAGADLARADLRRAVLVGATATAARLVEANLERAQASEWAAEGADLSRARLCGAMLAYADLSGALLEGADFTAANLNHADIGGAKAERACFERCVAPDLRAAERTNLSDAKLVLMEAPNAQLQEAIAFRANFAGSNLAGADLSDAVLCESNFVRCRLEGAKFARADLKFAQLLQANLFEADLEQADLREADLRGAHLFSAQLWRALTDGTRFEGANVGRTHLEGRWRSA